MVDLLLELGGDLNAVNVVGNDFVATAASAYSYGMWKEVITDPGLLAKCGRKHAGRTALQLLHCFISEPKQHCERRIKWWSGEASSLTWKALLCRSVCLEMMSSCPGSCPWFRQILTGVRLSARLQSGRSSAHGDEQVPVSPLQSRCKSWQRLGSRMLLRGESAQGHTGKVL